MPAKKRKPRNTAIALMRVSMHGQGANQDVFRFIKANPISGLEKANKTLQRTKAISGGLGLIAPFLGPKYGTMAMLGSAGAGMVGYGRRRRKKRVCAKKKPVRRKRKRKK